MPAPNLFQLYTTRLNGLNIPYMVTGSVAAIVYGEPRVTHDIDLVMTLPEAQVDRFCELFPLETFYCPPREIVKIERGKENRGHVTLVHHATGFKADIFFSGNEDLMIWALEHTRRIDYLGSHFPVAPVEYVILKKLEYYTEGESPKHISDIQAILRNSSHLVDHNFLKQKISQYGLVAAWQLC